MTRPPVERRSLKTLLITRNFPPLRGGMERLNERMFRHLHRNEPGSALVGPIGCRSYAPKGATVAQVPASPLPLALVAGLSQGVVMAQRMRPDLVLAGSGLSAPAALAAARASGAIPAVFLHGLDIVAPSRIYRLGWLPCIRRCERILVNSANTRRLAIDAGIDEARIRILHPGTDLPQRDPHARGRFRGRLGLDDKTPVLLSVGRLTSRKGLAEFIDRSLPAVHAAYPTLRLVVIGDQATNALHRGTGAGIKRVEATAQARGLAQAVMWLGPCDDADLADAYQGADVHVFPVRDIPGDVEGFGMVAVEAAAHGLQTVAFDVGGVADAVVDGESGRLVLAEDYEAFASAVTGILAADPLEGATRAVGFAQRFGWDRFGREIIEALTP